MRDDPPRRPSARVVGAGFHERVYAIVRRVPEGFVTTYGDVAEALGARQVARQVGYALAALSGRDDVPWHRVVNARGEVSPRAEPRFETIQRKLLEREGVAFDARGRVSLARFGGAVHRAKGRGRRASR